MEAILLVSMDWDANIKSPIHFFTSGTMLYAIATKYLHIFKDKKKSYLPGVWYPGASIWKLSLVSDVTKSLSARNERLTNV